MLFSLQSQRARKRTQSERPTREEQRRVVLRPRHCLRKRKDATAPHWTIPSKMRRRQEQYVQRRRAFLAWVPGQVSVVGAMLYRERTKTYMTVRFQRLHPALEITISDCGISISVTFAGQTWDMLADFDFAPKRIAGGYFDAMNLPEWQKIYPTTQALFEAEAFRYFKEWFDTKLRTADIVIVSGDPGRYTSARLAVRSASIDSKERTRLPTFPSAGHGANGTGET